LGQNNLGSCYHYGKGTTQDYKKAFEWYSKSANNGCIKGQSNLGFCFEKGLGTVINYEKAF
jgi:TPR repeat protein